VGEPALTVTVADAAAMEALGGAVGDALRGGGGLLALRGELGNGQDDFRARAAASTRASKARSAARPTP
jgi:hypothetical protein